VFECCDFRLLCGQIVVIVESFVCDCCCSREL
jgi:hypothetical protein